MTGLAVLLVVVLALLLLFPTSLTFVERFDGKQEVTHRVINVSDDYVLKSSLVPCVCPAASCPTHDPDAFGIKPTMPQEHIQALQKKERANATRKPVQPEPYFPDYNSMLKA